MNRFNIEISSIPDRDKLVAEIWKDLIAEINQEHDYLQIELYPLKKITFNYLEFLRILETAKNKLMNSSK